MNSCSPSKHSSEQNPSASNFLILPLSSSPCSSTPFLRQPFNLNPNPLLIETSNVIREMQKSICSNVDNFFKMLCNFRSQAGVVDKMMSFSSYIETCFQIPRGKRQNSIRLYESNFAAILPGDSVAGLVVTNGILNFLNIYNTLLVARLVLTWFPSAPPAIVSPLSTLCDPYLNIFRGIIPPLGGTLDLSPILAFLVLNAFTSTASALPAELPSAQVSKDTTVSDHTASQKKWMKRLAGNKPTRSNGEI